MSSWSLIAIGIAVGVILLPLGFWAVAKLAIWLLSRKLGAYLPTLAEGAADVPLRISLRPRESFDWSQEEPAQSQIQELLGLGFQPDGHYLVEEMGGVAMAAFVEPESGAAAYLCQHPALPLGFLDLIHLYEDGTSLTLSNLKNQGVDPCPAHPNLKMVGATPTELFRSLRDRSQSKTVKKIRAEQSKDVYERGHAAIMDWRVEKGGVSDEEIRANSPGEMSEQEWEQAREVFHQQHLGQVNELLRIRFSEQTQMSVQEWEQVRDRLLFVHDRLRPQDVQSLVEGEFYWLEEEVTAPIKPGREGFAELLGRLQMKNSLSQLGQVSGNIGADVYLCPEVPEDDC